MNLKALLEESGREGAIKILVGNLDSLDIGIVLDAMRHLTTLQAKDACEGLEKLTQHEDFLLRGVSIKALFKIDKDRVFSLIEKAVIQDEDSWIRMECAEMLGECSSKKEEAKRVLKEVLDDEKVEVRLKAASSLAKHGDVSGHRVALEAVENEKEKYDEDIRKEAVEILGEIGVNDEETIEAVKNYERETCVGRQTLERLGVRTRRFE